jgi:hypothetical protein
VLEVFAGAGILSLMKILGWLVKNRFILVCPLGRRTFEHEDEHSLSAVATAL